MLKHEQIFNRNTGTVDQGTMFLTAGIFLDTGRCQIIILSHMHPSDD